MLATIPTYRMVLNPESFLPENNPGKSYMELVCNIPNTGNIYRKQELSFQPVEKHEVYYRAHLLLEAKRFCREMLYNCSVDIDTYEVTLREGDLNDLFQLSRKFQLIFFRYMVLNDVKKYKLIKGHLEQEIMEAESVGEIQKQLRKYAVASKLFMKINDEYQKLKSIYC